MNRPDRNSRAGALAGKFNPPYTPTMILERERRLAMMRRVAVLNESLDRRKISWNEWSEQVAPLLCALNPELPRHGVLATRNHLIPDETLFQWQAVVEAQHESA